MDTELVIHLERSPGWCTWLIFVRPWLELDDFIFDITFLYFILVKEEKRSGNQVMIRKKIDPVPPLMFY